MNIDDIFRHFKGNEYRVIGKSLDAEGEELVPRVEYRSVKGGPVYSRTQENFLEIVDRPELDYRGPRFVFIRKAGHGNKKA